MPTLASERTEAKERTRAGRWRSKARAALACLVVVFAAASASAQREVPATVSGRVTNGERGMPGVVVMLVPSDGPPRSRTAARAKTDAEGRYRITNVPPGHYQAMPFAPAYVVEGISEHTYPPGKPLTLSAGDSAEDVDFRIERGGVITGRVTDAEGNPLIGQQVIITTADTNPNTVRRVVGIGPMSDPRAHQTDDRGVYRIYGLPAGRYHVSAGSDTDNGAISFGRRNLYRRTFYPDATDESQAQVVEVSAGGEAENVDIKLGSPVKTYRASGRFVDAATGQPVPNVAFGYGVIDPTGQHIMNFGGGLPANADGEFVADGLTPGHYAAFVYPFMSPQDAGDFYSDPAVFDVVDADVKGIVVRVKHGSTITGVVAVEGAADASTAARLAGQVQVFAQYDGTNGAQSALSMPGYVRPTPPSPDGSFRVTGLRPGRVQLMVSGQPGLTLSRVEMNGAVVTGGIDVTEGAQLGGVRVVVNYGNAVIRGQVNYVNGTLPQDAHVIVIAQRAGSDPGTGGRGAQVDSRGRFTIEGLAAGEYDVVVHAYSVSLRRPLQSDRQHASLAPGGDATVALTLDLGAQPGGVKP
ncbi:MAG TPA: carboxypeptidase-like regulatory domain-containing protein [Pyrinomonadaceae bacterium]|nr:carboxypeptidase-like regulatory domain-containing protein [Pyrinomonadaceae bacterium]